MELIINNIHKTYGSFKALDNINIELTTGIYALLGPNGSGKSTLMNIISGNLKANIGQVYIKEDTRKTPLKATMEKIGYLPQSLGINKDLSVNDFMLFMSALKGLNKDKANKQTECLLTSCELMEVRNKRVKHLSGGMRQRLGIAQALLGQPDILILDEPMVGLDPAQRIKINKLLAANSSNKIILISTHLVNDIDSIASNAIILKQGVVIDMDTPINLSAKVNGLVWSITVNDDMANRYQIKYNVINTFKDIEGVHLRMISSNPPEGAVATSATLEDYYLSIFT